MAVECAACQTDNRDGAKFCKGCGRRLVASAADVWPETQRMPLQTAPNAMIVSDEDAVVIDPAPSLPNFSQRQPRRISEKKKKKSRLALFSMLGLFVVAVVSGMAWRSNERSLDSAVPMAAEKDKPAATALLAPASSSLSSSSAPTPGNSGPAGPVARGPVAVEPPASQPEAPPKAPPPAPATTPLQAATARASGIGPTSPQRQVAQRQPQATPPAQTQKQKQAEKQRSAAIADEATTRKPRKATPAPAAPAAPVAVTQTVPALLAAAPAVLAEAPALPSPSAVCAGQGFFARGRCMVAQCAKADYRTHSQCDAVRRQEQLDEEKRNPAQLN